LLFKISGDQEGMETTFRIRGLELRNADALVIVEWSGKRIKILLMPSDIESMSIFEDVL